MQLNEFWSVFKGDDTLGRATKSKTFDSNDEALLYATRLVKDGASEVKIRYGAFEG